MTKGFIGAGFLLIAWVVSAPAIAQTDSPSDPAKVELGGEIFDLTSGKQDYIARLQSIGETLSKNINANSANTDREMTDIGKIVVHMLPQFREASAEAYARHFSLDELKALRSFYSSPAGEKLAEEQGEISHEVMQATMPEMISEIRALYPPKQTAVPQQTLQDAPQPVK